MNNNQTSASSSSSALPPSWIELPDDLTLNILGRLGPVDILDGAERVCTTWRSACKEPSLWRVFRLKYSYKLHTRDNAEPLCRRVVDRSRGELIDINIKDFWSDDLLLYISERTSHLKSLTLGYSPISPKVLTDAVKSFPHLVELRLIFIQSIHPLDIEAIGASCPMLKSFTLKNPFHFLCPTAIDNSHALSIAKNMPNLGRLCLSGNPLNNEGLLAILDCCPNLESLDLRGSFCVDMECDLGIRCSRQIRELRCPIDSASGYDPADLFCFHTDYSEYD